MYHSIFMSNVMYSVTEINFISLQCRDLFVQDSVFDGGVFVSWLLLEATVLIFEIEVFGIC